MMLGGKLRMAILSKYLLLIGIGLHMGDEMDVAYDVSYVPIIA